MPLRETSDKSRQYDVVQAVMRSNGGYATLGHLYQNVVRMPGWASSSKTPFASIRRIVQDERFFFRIVPGLWGLKEEEAAVRAKLRVQAGPADSPAILEFSHTHFQGLLVELGNYHKYETHIDYHDRNRRFLSRPMSEVATLPDCEPFTYPNLIRKASTVDVIWFNDRKLPYAFFEIEHTTGVYNSLLKFLEFQDFRIKFHIVADEVRRPEYEDKLGSVAFKPIREEVKFLDYKTVAEQHTLALKQMTLGQI